MTSLRSIALRSIIFRARQSLLLLLGLSVATAVIVGALLVGDSVRGSMRGLVLDRLGRIEWVMLAPHYVQSALVGKLSSEDLNAHGWSPPIPTILFASTSVEASRGGERRRASSVQTLAVPPDFWQLGSVTAPPILDERGVAVTTSLAQELNLEVGDIVTLRIPASQAVPPDSPLGRRDDQTVSLPRLTVSAILPDDSIAGFSLHGSQSGAKNAFLPLALVQSVLRKEDQVNAFFFGQSGSASAFPLPGPPLLASEIGPEFWHQLAWQLDDFGLSLEQVQRDFPDPARQESSDASPQRILDYIQISSRQLLFPPAAEQAVAQAVTPAESNQVLTYLANAIQKVARSELDDPSREVTYSTITGIPWGNTFPSAATFGLREPAPGEAVVNDWLAQRLELTVGDRIRIFYYLPETSYGKEVEEAFDLQVVGIVPLTSPSRGFDRRRLARFDRPPTPFNDPDLTPEVPGITDQDSIYDWDTPFVLQRKVSTEDDNYWRDHRLTPKVFLSLAEAQQRFGSRFGRISSVRIPPDRSSISELESRIIATMADRAKDLGFQMVPVRQRQLSAASGTTPFDGLFLALSFFVIAAGLILAWLLFRLGIEQRADQLGLLAASGWTTLRIQGLLAWESGLLSLLSAALGIAMGWLYAVAMIAALKTWWVGAIATPFLSFHWNWSSILIGFLAGSLVTWMTTVSSVSRLVKIPPLRLLRGRTAPEPNRLLPQPTWKTVLPLVLAVLAAVVGVVGAGQPGQARAGAFLGASMLLLTAATVETHRRLSKHHSAGIEQHSMAPLLKLANFNIRSNPMRSTLSVGLIAVATFLVVVMGIFQAKPDLRSAGGFTLIGESAQPIVKDLNDRAYRRLILGERSSSLEEVEILPLRLRLGDNASCSNLFQAAQPRVLGVPPGLDDHQRRLDSSLRFPWAATGSSERTPWEEIQRPASGDQNDPIPVIIDQNTAQWSLHRGSTVGERFEYEYDDRSIHFETVGLLQNSTLQGMLLIGQPNFENLFPKVVGFQYFLIDAPAAQLSSVTSILEDGWEDLGLDIVPSSDILKKLLGVQNTYLSAFQTLGALGLVLGTFGLAIVQIRSVIERRSELALMRALGFDNLRIGALLFSESVLLLLTGTFLGVGCALLAVIPNALRGQPLSDFQGPAFLVMVVLAVGIIAGFVAAVRAMQLPLLDTLRGK